MSLEIPIKHEQAEIFRVLNRRAIDIMNKVNNKITEPVNKNMEKMGLDARLVLTLKDPNPKLITMDSNFEKNGHKYILRFAVHDDRDVMYLYEFTTHCVDDTDGDFELRWDDKTKGWTNDSLLRTRIVASCVHCGAELVTLPDILKERSLNRWERIE